MLNEALIFDADLSPTNWFLNGKWHYDSINSDIIDRNIYCVGPDIEDWVSMTDPVGDIGALVEMRITIKNKSVNADGTSSGLVGCAYHILKSDDTELGSYGLQMATNPLPHEYNIVAPLVGTGADTPNMKMRIRSFSIGIWPVGQGLIQTYQILPTLYYETPALRRAGRIELPERKFEAPITFSESVLQVPERKFDVPITFSESVLQVPERKLSKAVILEEPTILIPSRKQSAPLVFSEGVDDL